MKWNSRNNIKQQFAGSSEPRFADSAAFQKSSKANINCTYKYSISILIKNIARFCWEVHLKANQWIKLTTRTHDK